MKRLLLALALVATAASAQVLQLPPGTFNPPLTTIRSGAGAPASTVGNNGDWYIDTSAKVLYGPKAAGAWPTPGISLGGGTWGSIAGTLADQTDLQNALDAKQAAGNYLTGLTVTGDIGDSVSGAGSPTLTLTLPNINSNVGSFGDGSHVPVLSVNAKGQITAVSTAAVAAGMSNPMSAAGDMIIGGASGAPTRVAAGTNGYCWMMVSGLPAWAACPSGGYTFDAPFSLTGSELSLTLGTSGGLAVSNGALDLTDIVPLIGTPNTFTALNEFVPGLTLDSRSTSPGTPASGKANIYVNSTDGELHLVNSSGTDTPIGGGGGGMTNPMTAAGDLIIGGTSGTPTRLPKGTNGYCLLVTSGAPAWGAYPGGSSATSLVDSNGKTEIATVATANAVDYLTVTNSAAGSPGTVTISTAGTDAGVGLVLDAKGGPGQGAYVSVGTDEGLLVNVDGNGTASAGLKVWDISRNQGGIFNCLDYYAAACGFNRGSLGSYVLGWDQSGDVYLGGTGGRPDTGAGNDVTIKHSENGHIYTHGSAPTISGSNCFSGSNAASTTASVTASSTSITVTSATGIAVGQTVVDAGNVDIPAGTTVTAVSGTTITLSQAATTTNASDTVYFINSSTNNDVDGSIATIGIATCTITFAHAWATAPFPQVTSGGANGATASAESRSTTAVVLHQAFNGQIDTYYHMNGTN